MTQGTSPIYNLLPDVLSNLSGESELSQKGFQDIMRHLLQYIGKERHADSLVDKLCARFGSTQDLRQWRNLAFCVAQVRQAVERFHQLQQSTTSRAFSSASERKGRESSARRHRCGVDLEGCAAAELHGEGHPQDGGAA